MTKKELFSKAFFLPVSLNSVNDLDRCFLGAVEKQEQRKEKAFIVDTGGLQ